MPRLPRIAALKDQDAGFGFYLCTRKDRRPGRSGADLIEVVLQDVSGQITAKVLKDVDALAQEFDTGEFVKVQGRANIHFGRLEIVVEKIRRAHPSLDAADGFREEDCIPAAPRPVDEMWRELESRIASVEDPAIRELLTTIVAQHGERLRIWPAARQVHHAYRSGLLEHVLAIMDVVVFLADRYGARKDLLIAGALLHDIGKLIELSYDVTTEYTPEGNLVGHIAIGSRMVHEAGRAIPGLRPEVLMEIEHLILSHHGDLELGSPVKPMTLEAFILAAADDLDARMHQVRRLLSEDPGDGPFTTYNRHLERALYKRPSTDGR
jgi:3'-5' exoribonuclease